MLQRVAVTGMSAMTCFGRGLAPLVAALDSGQRGLRKIDRMPTGDPWFRTDAAMQIALADLLAGLPPGFAPDRVGMEYPTILSVMTALDAYRDAQLRGDCYRARRFAVWNGTSRGASHGMVEVLSQRAAGKAPDSTALSVLASWPARRIAHRVGARGPNVTIDTACSSALIAIGQAAKQVATGQLDCAIAGGSDMFSYLSYAGFNSLSALDPAGCRPLDRAREGMSLGDGAAYVVLEREEDARARGARLWGVITGYACAGEGHHPTSPEPGGRGALQVMTAALCEDGAPRELDFIAAHGTGTQANDSAELIAIASLVQSLDIPGPVHVSSIKGHIGHTLGASGALQVVATLACMAQDMIPGNAGLGEPIPHEPPLVIKRESVRKPLRLALCNAFGFGGTVASVCVRSARGEMHGP